jgi:hypothetical protein
MDIATKSKPINAAAALVDATMKSKYDRGIMILLLVPKSI